MINVFNKGIKLGNYISIKSFILVLLLISTLTSCQEHSDHYELEDNEVISSKTVHIKETVAKDQGYTDFCWSYTIMAMLESIELKKRRSYNLSEEYLGFYHLLNQLKHAIKSENVIDELSYVSGPYFVWNGMNLMESVGIVPEEVFNAKFTKYGNQLTTKIKKFFIEKVKDINNLEKYRKDDSELRRDLSKLFGSRPIAPNEKFEYKGKVYTPISFLKEELKFDRDDYEAIELYESGPENFEVAIQKVKVSLMSGVSVPIGVTTFDGVGSTVWDTNSCGSDCTVNGGHAMLVTDFKTEGGEYGMMPLNDVDSIFNNSLESLMVKNSWGLYGLNQNGQASTNDYSGYNILNLSFLKKSFGADGITFIIPKSIYDNDGNSFYGASLKSIINIKSFITKDEIVKMAPSLLDVPREFNLYDVDYRWKVANTDGEVLFKSMDKSFEFQFRKEGEYTISLVSMLNGLESIDVKKVWVASKPTNLLQNSFDIIYSDNIDIDFEKSSILFDLSKDHNSTDFIKYEIRLPKMKFESNGKIRINYILETDTAIYPDLEVSYDGLNFKTVLCSYFQLMPNNASEIYEMNCLYNVDNSKAIDDSELIFRFITYKEHANQRGYALHYDITAQFFNGGLR